MLRPLRLNRLGLVIGIALLGSIPGVSQTVDFIDGVAGTAKFGRPIGFGPAQAVPSAGSVNSELAFFSKGFFSFTRNIPMNIVGTDPGSGAATTTIPTVIVPLKITFTDSANTLDGTNVVVTITNSPIFQIADYTVDGTDLGMTQYGDAVQRGQFWNLPGFSQAGYHVLLGPPTIAPTVNVTVPSGSGIALLNSRGALVGRVNANFLDPIITSLAASYPANQLPIILTDNVFEYNGTPSNCCVLGYHSSHSGPIATALTWIFAAYTEFNTFSGNAFADSTALSHEVSEWLNDPFVGSFFPGVNFIPPAILPNQGGACIMIFETGDPLAAPPVVFTKTIGGTTYNLQDEAFLWWYLHTTPSPGVNGFYSLLGTFTRPSTLCGPG
jgi:hypothetical protein